MLDQKIRVYWDKTMAPIGRFVGRSRISPNAVTLLGLLVQTAVAWLILDGAVVAAGLLAVVAGVFDVLDGAVAKARGLVSRFGAFLDSTVDRVSDALYFLPIAWLYAVDPDVPAHDDEWVAVLAMVTLVLSFMVSYVKARAEGLGFECKVGLAERAERVIIVVLGLLFDVIPIALAILAAASLVTVIHRIVHVRRQAAAGDP
ncbi:MAG: CDP-alcohol phosphatidyltransferase family protein [Actinobacteria bacterium]|nr:CDP-alcohol phosphatidyltransferase family protein [Actinomycetota bacterium]